MPSRRVRLAVALAIGLVAVLRMRANAPAFAPPAHGPDVDQVLAGARAVLAGRSPYAEVGPGRAFDWPWGLYYPFTAVLAALPLAWLPIAAGRVAFVGASAALLAWAVTRDGWHRLTLFLGGAAFVAVNDAQWSPLLTAAMLLPSVGWLAAAKPNVGLAVLAVQRSRRDLGIVAAGCAALVLVSLAVRPSWPLEWRAALATSSHFSAPVANAGGVVLLLALFRWRRPEARLLLALACVPQTTVVYEVLPLALVAATFRESLVLALLTWAAFAAELAVRADAPTFAAGVRASGDVMVALCYLPALLLVWRRRNEWPAGDRGTPVALDETGRPHSPEAAFIIEEAQMADERNLTERGVDNSVDGKIDHAKGHIKDAIGGLTGDSSLQAEGKGDQLKGKVKDAVGKVERKLDE